MRWLISVFAVMAIAAGPSLTELNAATAQAGEWGEFRGNVEASWDADGRTMTLLKDFIYIDPKGDTWIAPVDSKVDGASIPRAAWRVIGSPFTGKYRNASVIHDVACVEQERPWEAVHEAFYHAMRAGGVGVVKAKAMYAAVYLGGPRWPRKLKREAISKAEAERIAADVRAAADPGSKITERVTQNEPSRAGGPATVDLLLRIQPAPALTEEALTEEVLQKLETTIDAGDLSLDEIRKLKP